MTKKDDDLERYEKEEEVRALIALLKTAQPPSELEAPVDFQRKVLKRIEQLPARAGLLQRWRTYWSGVEDTWLIRLCRTFRTVTLHPAFAYSLVFLLSIPLLRSYDIIPAKVAVSTQPKDQTIEEVLGPETRGLKEVLEAPTRTRGWKETERVQVQKEAETFLRTTYRAAYESREIESLTRIWPMSQEWRDVLTRLFTDSRDLVVLLDIDSKAIKAKEDGQVVVPFAQAIMTVDREGQFSSQGPFFCLADLQRRSDPGGWVMQNVRDDPEHGGRCRPQ